MKKEKTISDIELELAMENCAKEPIQIPGSIQSHGFMFILNNEFKIKKISENILNFLNKQLNEVIDKNLNEFIDEKFINELKTLRSEGALNPIRSMTLSFKFTDELFDAIIHENSAGYQILELEENHNHSSVQDLYKKVMSFSVNLQKTSNTEMLYNYVVNEVRSITGFARVKLYQFDRDWNGLVIAESKENHMHSYLGLHFPQSDIPVQARKLYSKNYLRLIPDINSKASKILPNNLDHKSEAIDMSFSVLRTVSPVHIEYLNNMNVQASMSISIMQNGKLWGLIACHHDKPLHVPYSVRMIAELFGHTFSALLTNYSQSNENEKKQQKELCVNEVHAILNSNINISNALKVKYKLLLKSVDADGLIANFGDKHFAFGIVPEMPVVKKIIQWLEAHYQEEIFISNSINKDTDLFLEEGSSVSGLIATPVSSEMKDYLLWFRSEQISDMNWAGKPEKVLSKNTLGYHLTPRASFDRWQEKLRSYSRPWSQLEIETAQEVSQEFLKKRYEDILCQKTNNLDSIIKNSNATVYIMNTKKQIMSINDKALKTFGCNNSVIGKSISEIFDHESASLIEGNFQEIISKRDSITFEQTFFINNKKISFISAVFPLFDSNNDVYAICTISTDISKLKETEADLIKSNKELEHMAFIASHDLQEPLRIIANFTDILNEDYKNQLDNDAQRYIDFVLSATKRMQNLITDLLLYSKLSNQDDNKPLIESQTELNKVIDDLNLAYQDKGIKFIVSNPLPEIYMKAEHFYCIMQNLLTNAIKYTRDPNKIEITISCNTSQGFWTFSVTDNGIGIKPKYYEKIFLIFQRLHKNEYPGTGIGLALCKRIIGAYRGEIWVESEYGKGSSFYFTIPKRP
ncbi:MAG: GAF domain-containing protein [Candidatus Caenarcaniphilales bacterium]|nr:GAF domain-containing protein [Candidatus Caenarcaniphilales bacterium]